jgi:hypothetical protein
VVPIVDPDAADQGNATDDAHELPLVFMTMPRANEMLRVIANEVEAHEAIQARPVDEGKRAAVVNCKLTIDQRWL